MDFTESARIKTLDEIVGRTGLAAPFFLRTIVSPTGGMEILDHKAEPVRRDAFKVWKLKKKGFVHFPVPPPPPCSLK